MLSSPTTQETCIGGAFPLSFFSCLGTIIVRPWRAKLQLIGRFKFSVVGNDDDEWNFCLIRASLQLRERVDWGSVTNGDPISVLFEYVKDRMFGQILHIGNYLVDPV